MLFLDGTCPEGLAVIVKLIKTVMWYITIIVPIVLVVIGTFDLFKAVTASKEDEIKAAQKLLIKRIIYAILIFLIVPIITLVFGIFDSATKDAGDTGIEYHSSWYECWKNPTDSHVN